MNLAQALKKKNRLVNEINQLKANIPSYVSALTVNEYPKIYQDEMGKLNTKIAELIDLKVKIQKANIGILPHIYELAETKSKMGFLSSIKRGIKNGIFYESYNNMPPQEYKSQVSVNEIDAQIETAQKHIENLQDSIDEYNAKTQI